MTDGNTPPLPPRSHFISDYAELKHLIKEAGLLEKQLLYYARKMILLLAMLTLSILVLLFVQPFWLQLLNAAYLAFVTTQLALLGHDAGHRQIFHTTWKNDVVSLVTGNLLVGMSHGWWLDRHSKHHSHPNQLNLDPDVSIPIIAFAQVDLYGKGRLLLGLMKYQAFYFFPVLSLASLENQRNSVQFLFRQKVKYAVTERLLLGMHFLCYLGILFFCLAMWQVVLFILVHQVLSGVYMGSIFAPNHKGMPVLETNNQADFLHRQVITSRNVHAHPVTDFWYGGLNYQIEHHLFPSLPRNQLKKAQGIIKPFCQARALPYYETNWLQSYRETLHSLHQVSASLRKRKSSAMLGDN